MRSSRSGADPLDPGPAGYAHRGLHAGIEVPENSLASFAAALDAGAGIECDLRLTTDDRIVVFHDPNGSRLCGNPMRIGRSRLQDLSDLRVGAHPIPTLQDLLSLVAARTPILLEAKVDRDLRRWVPALRRDLAGYAGAFGVMSFDPRLSRLLKNGMPNVRRGLVIRDSLPAMQRKLALWLADPQFVSVETRALGKAWVDRIRQRIPTYSWTVRTPAERGQASVHADAAIWEADGRPRN